jgi:hypothetical protein
LFNVYRVVQASAPTLLLTAHSYLKFETTIRKHLAATNRSGTFYLDLDSQTSGREQSADCRWDGLMESVHGHKEHDNLTALKIRSCPA